METSQMTLENVLQHQLVALGNNDIEELMQDYCEHSELWTPDGAINGLQAISAVFLMHLLYSPKKGRN